MVYNEEDCIKKTKANREDKRNWKKKKRTLFIEVSPSKYNRSFVSLQITQIKILKIMKIWQKKNT